MKYIVVILLSILSITASAQTYSAAQGTVSNKPYAPAQAVPTDSRSYYYDGTNFIWRPYQSTTEVLSYLNLTKYRVGHFPIFVNPTGTLNGDGSFTGGNIVEYWFKNGTANANLVPKYDTTKAWQQALIDSSSNIRTTVNSKQSNITLTTTGTSGPATLVGSTLNVPQYAASGSSVSITGSSSTGVIVTPSPLTGTGTIKIDTTVIPSRLYLQKIADSLSAIQDTVDIVNILTAGTALSYGNVTADTVWLKRIQAGSNITLTQNSDSSVSISSPTVTLQQAITNGSTLSASNTIEQGGFITRWRAGGAGYYFHTVVNGSDSVEERNSPGEWRVIGTDAGGRAKIDLASNGQYINVLESSNYGSGNTGIIVTYPDSISFKQNNGDYRYRGVRSIPISSSVKPLMWDSSSSRVYYGPTPMSGFFNNPTYYTVLNTGSPSTTEFYYQIIGDVVHVFGKISIVSSGAGAGELDITFPVATTIANDYDVAGTGVDSGHPGEPLEISGDVSNNRIRLKTIFASSGTRTYFVTFMYKYSPS